MRGLFFLRSRAAAIGAPACSMSASTGGGGGGQVADPRSFECPRYFQGHVSAGSASTSMLDNARDSGSAQCRSGSVGRAAAISRCNIHWPGSRRRLAALP